MGEFKIEDQYGEEGTITVERTRTQYRFTWTCGEEYEINRKELRQALDLLEGLPRDPRIIVDLSRAFPGMGYALTPVKGRGHLRVSIVEIDIQSDEPLATFILKDAREAMDAKA